MNPYFETKKIVSDGIKRRFEKKIPPASRSASREEIIAKIAKAEKPRENFKENPVKEADAEEKTEILISPGRPEEKNKKFKLLLVSGGIFLILIAGAAILLSTAFARLTVTVKPTVESVKFGELLIAADISVAKTLAVQRVIPAEKLEINKKLEEEFKATGREFIEEKARGRVKIYNRFSSSPQTLVAGTRFLTDNGKLYRLVRTTVIPGALIEEGKIVPQLTEEELAADQAGEEGNIKEETTLKIPAFKGTAKYDGFYAAATAGFAGGFKGEAKVISAEDVKKAEEMVSKKVYDELQKEIAVKSPREFKFLDGLREIQITKLNSPAVKSRRESFAVSAEGKGRVLLFREEDVYPLLKEIIVADNEKKNLISGSLETDYRPTQIDFDKGRAEISLKGAVKTKAEIPQEELKEEARGKKEGSLIETLRTRKDLSSFKLSFFPPWLFRAPSDSAKIRIIIEEP